MAEKMFPIVAIPANQPELLENLGTKEKFWITLEDKRHLIKFGRPGTGEDWAEKVACELCTLLGLPHAHYDLAICGGRSCVITPNLVPSDGRLILGNELISYTTESAEGVNTYQQREHTVRRVLAALRLRTQLNWQRTWHHFLGYLLLDAWIGNTDRHHENWGIIRVPDQPTWLAPTFDHASSLGRELTDDNRKRRLLGKDPRVTVETYASKARSALFEESTDSHPLTTRAAFLLAARAMRQSGFYWLQALAGIDDEQVGGILERIPPECMSVTAKEFARALLAANRSALLDTIGPKR